MRSIPLVKYGPKSDLSPTLGDPCPLCGVPFARGDFTTLVRRTAESAFADDGAEVHWTCVARRWPRATGPQR